jgi:transposase
MFLIIRHYLLETNCDHCDHVSRAQPWRSAGEHEWERVELGEWRLVGPQLAGLIVFLALRLRLSRPRIREALMEMFGLLLSVGVIDETLREAGRASFPLEDVLVADLLQEPQLNVDETSWPENRLLLWLWALVTPLDGPLRDWPAARGNAGECPAGWLLRHPDQRWVTGSTGPG